jgi:hypothetical protein
VSDAIWGFLLDVYARTGVDFWKGEFVGMEEEGTAGGRWEICGFL